jgi:hypothetical protein
VIDVQIGTVGYLLTLRPLDAHIRSGNPFLAGWLAALMCYPPFVFTFMGDNGVIQYEYQTCRLGRLVRRSSGGAVAVGRVAGVPDRGLRLGDRGVRDAVLEPDLSRRADQRTVPLHAPPGLRRQEPVLVVLDDALLDDERFIRRGAAQHGVPGLRQRHLLLGARTEEAHLLSEDPKYRAYHAWMAEHGLITAPLRRFLTKAAPAPPAGAARRVSQALPAT